MSLVDTPLVGVNPVDFRRPSRISRDAVVALEGLHEVFARRLSTAWSTSTYTAVEIEHVATEQLSIDDFVRSLPVPTVLGTIRVPRLATNVFLQVDVHVALLVVERVLGGSGDPASVPVARRPTELEARLLDQQMFGPAVQAVDEVLRDLDGEPSDLAGLDDAPQSLQLGAPGELVLLLTYRVELRGDVDAEGLVTLAYPVGPVVGHLDRLLGVDDPEPDTASRAECAMRDALLDAVVDLRVRLGESTLPAARLAALGPGDVLRLDHEVGRPARLVVDDREVGTAHLGRRRRKVAIQIVDPPARRNPNATDGPPHPQSDAAVGAA